MAGTVNIAWFQGILVENGVDTQVPKYPPVRIDNLSSTNAGDTDATTLAPASATMFRIFAETESYRFVVGPTGPGTAAAATDIEIGPGVPEFGSVPAGGNFLIAVRQET